MRKLLKWIVVTVGVTALVRWFRRRRAEPEIATPTTDDPAEELRRKLAESREEEQAETPAASETTVEERRADVHEQGRATLDEMNSPDEA